VQLLRDRADALGAPQVIFTDPQVRAVGRTEEQARADGFRIRTVDSDIGAVVGAQLQVPGYTGRAWLVVDEDRRVLLGAAFVGPAAADLKDRRVDGRPPPIFTPTGRLPQGHQGLLALICHPARDRPTNTRALLARR
jgi:hypothetical protein